jgi:hypothetical protein
VAVCSQFKLQFLANIQAAETLGIFAAVDYVMQFVGRQANLGKNRGKRVTFTNCDTLIKRVSVSVTVVSGRSSLFCSSCSASLLISRVSVVRFASTSLEGKTSSAKLKKAATPLAASKWLLGYSGGLEVGVMVWVRFLKYEMKMTKK